MRKLLILASVMLAFVAALAVACGGDDYKSSSGSSSGAGADVAPTASGSAAGAVQDISLKTGENGQAYFFNPKEVKLKPGQVKVTITNDGPERPHNFVVKNLNGQGDLASMDRLNPGQSNSVTFTVVAGTYQFICSLPGHADRGAQGTLVVAN
ncbi:MAG TPA: plastocyanin/azurin family copper-binding protein [Dehalococcoidia bacterium]|nr:plastocyanin/azurin family copper-binding protein [Dehalococcoidia bacterium]